VIELLVIKAITADHKGMLLSLLFPLLMQGISVEGIIGFLATSLFIAKLLNAPPLL
jgi:hypothetical protein